jgi:hypothetical protein
MSTDTVTRPGYIAGAAIERGDLFHLDASNNYPNVIKTAADTDKPLGYALADAAENEAVQWAPICGEVYMCRASGAISEEAEICPDADGEVKAAASADFVCGIALKAAANANDEIPCLLFHGWTKA